MTGETKHSQQWTPSPGDVLAGKYRIERVLGEGGMGVVYAAHHELLDQRVAIKLLLPEITKNREAVARFLNEARAASRIQNEHVARVLDVGRLDDSVPYMVIEFLDGEDLAQVLARCGPLPFADVVDWTMQALEAIAQAHALGIVHRDLKPSNLFLARRQDGTSQIKVLDFGISKALDPGGVASSRAAVTATNAIMGSPAYMSPEQLRNTKGVDARADIWAIGVVAYELLTAGLPFDGDNVVALFASIQENAPRLVQTTRPDVPAVLDACIQKCLRANPRERFATVAELAQAIAPFGTRASALACERIARIQPPATPSGDALPPARASYPEMARTAQQENSPTIPALAASGRVQTAAPWATPRTPAVQKTRGQLVMVLVALGVLAVGGAGVGAAIFVKGRSKPIAAAEQPPAVAPPTATPPAPPASATATATATAAAAAAPSKGPPAAHAPAASITKAPAPDCKNPWYVDSAGIMRPKPECLK